MKCLTLSASLLTSQPATVTLPLSADRTPARIRMQVVLPAPSGPTKPKISPEATLKSRPSIARTPGNRFTSPRTSTSARASLTNRLLLTRRGQVDCRVGRHPRLQLVIWILEIDLDPIHKGHAFYVGLDTFRRELRVGRDECDVAPIVFAGIRVGCDHRRLAPVDAPEIGFIDVGAKPDVIEIGHCHDRRARLHHFAEFGLSCQNHARERRIEDGVAQIDLGELKAFSGALNACVGDPDVALGGAAHGDVAVESRTRLL